MASANPTRSIIKAGLVICIAAATLLAIGWYKQDRSLWKARRDVADLKVSVQGNLTELRDEVKTSRAATLRAVESYKRDRFRWKVRRDVAELKASLHRDLTELRDEVKTSRTELADVRTNATAAAQSIPAALSQFAMSLGLDKLPVLHGFEPVVFNPADRPLPLGGLSPTSYKHVVPCGPTEGGRVMVLLALGQSNAANYGGRMSRSAFGDKVLNYWDGRCFIAEDPILGADGNSGSLWPEFANRLIADGVYDKVIIVGHAFGGTSMRQWETSGVILPALSRLVRAMDVSGVHLTDVFWIQGEAERAQNSPYHDNQAAYEKALNDVINTARAHSPAARAFVATASSCPSVIANFGPTPAIRKAQQGVLSHDRQIFAGADLDLIADFEDRFDICHLTGSGMSKVIAEMETAVRQVNSSPN